MTIRLKNFVTEPEAATQVAATAHFQGKLSFETDCWDVHASERLDERGFVLLDVRSPGAFEGGHLPGAVNIPTSTITEEWLAAYATDTLFVTYCAGPHCNGSTRAALRIAALGRPVKEMLGGSIGWADEGFQLVTL